MKKIAKKNIKTTNNAQACARTIRDFKFNSGVIYELSGQQLIVKASFSSPQTIQTVKTFTKKSTENSKKGKGCLEFFFSIF